MQPSYSIQRYLLKTLLIGLPLIGLLISATTAWRFWHEFNEINDTQITQLTRYLIGISQENEHDFNYSHSATNLVTLSTPLASQPLSVDIHTQNSHTPAPPKIFHLENSKLSGDLGEAKEDYLGFAIWRQDGQLLMADENGKNFRFLPHQHGFLEKKDHSYERYNPFEQRWRLFYAHDDKTKRLIAVGQNLQSRQEIIYKSLSVQIAPALIGLFLFISLVLVLVKRGFAPLSQVSETLKNRDPHDERPLNIAVPSEIQPLANALNQLFVKVADTLAREQRFTADASHEIRSPLTALKLQTDVLQQQILHSNLSEQDEDQLFHQTQKISEGIDRANHLVEQLLTLAKLAPEQCLNPEQLVPIDWHILTDNVLSEVNRNAREKHIQLKREYWVMADQAIMPLIGNATLISLLLRNLLDNAIRYCPEGSTVTLALAADSIQVIDNGTGVAVQDLTRLSERFFRPAGQSQPGSGLGLSIVKRIADLHHLHVEMQNRVEHQRVVGFVVKLSHD